MVRDSKPENIPVITKRKRGFRALPEQRKRSSKIDRYFKSKTRFKGQNAFLELNMTIKFKGERPVQAYGYSKDFRVDNDAQLRVAIEKAKLNAYANGYYQVGGVDDIYYEDIDYLDSNEIESIRLDDFNFYYLNFKDFRSISYKNKKGNKIIRFQQKDDDGRFKFVKGGGREEDTQQSDQDFRNRFEVSEVGQTRNKKLEEFR